MSTVIGQEAGGYYGTWAWARTVFQVDGSDTILNTHSKEYTTLPGYTRAGFHSAGGRYLRGQNLPAVTLQIQILSQASPAPYGGYYLYSSLYIGTGATYPVSNKLDESHATAIVGQTVTLKDDNFTPGNTFTLTADYKDTLDGVFIVGVEPPGSPSTLSGPIDTVGLLTSFNS
jgi:hypothetical protein